MLAGLKNIPSSMKQLLVVALMLVVVFDSVVATNQQWANINGLWGKRSDPKMVSFLYIELSVALKISFYDLKVTCRGRVNFQVLLRNAREDSNYFSKFTRLQIEKKLNTCFLQLNILFNFLRSVRFH